MQKNQQPIYGSHGSRSAASAGAPNEEACLSTSGIKTGRVLQAFGNRFIVQAADGTYDCGIRGIFRLSAKRQSSPVVVGDRVKFVVAEPPYGTIEEIAERRNKLSRPDVDNPDFEQVIVANIEQLIVVTSVDKPRLKLGAIDRFLLAAERCNMDGRVCINKIDLGPIEKHRRAMEIYRAAGYPVVACSALTGQGMEGVRRMVQYHVSLVAGHSGVGKSTIINALQPGLSIKTAEISAATGKGVHTTTAVQLHPLDFGGYIADAPGLREVGLWEIQPGELAELYPEMRRLGGNCRFRNCVHIGEPGCAIKDAVARGELAPERYEGYTRIFKSLS
ncbi:ribosome small subunit-dependent GTPase A [Candidatus Zixiibacteriota bacterium]